MYIQVVAKKTVMNRDTEGKPYSYICEIEDVNVGDLVRVPFGKSEVKAQVVSVDIEEPSLPCKLVIEKLDWDNEIKKEIEKAIEDGMF